jgi:hypothetical protein
MTDVDAFPSQRTQPCRREEGRERRGLAEADTILIEVSHSNRCRG